MAFSAGQAVVDTRQGEVFMEAAGDLPVLFSMAFLAAVAQIPTMGIFMAVDTLVRERFVAQDGPVDAFVSNKAVRALVTFRTLGLGMLELEREGALLIMVKGIRFPSILAMALGATLIELALMIILVAGQTLLLAHFREKEFAQAEDMGRVFFAGIRPFDRRCGCGGGHMAVYALHFGVSPREFVTGLVVVKRQTVLEALRVMAGRASLSREFFAELVNVGVFVAVDAKF